MKRKSSFFGHILLVVIVIIVVGLTSLVINLDLQLSNAISTIIQIRPFSNNEITLPDNSSEFVPINRVDLNKVTVGDIEIAYKTFGNGKPILILVDKIPEAWLVQIENAGHGLMYQYSEIFTEIVKTFLNAT